MRPGDPLTQLLLLPQQAAKEFLKGSTGHNFYITFVNSLRNDCFTFVLQS